MTRRALIVGIDRYEHADFLPLKYAEADAARVRDFLHTLDGPAAFSDVQCLYSTGDHDILRALRTAVRGLGRGDLFFFYFAGHGVQQHAHGQHLLLATDAMPDVLETENTNGTLPHKMLGQITTGTFNRVLIIDACRDNYFRQDPRRRSLTAERTMEGARALREIGRAGKGLGGGNAFTLWSCNDGERALEDEALQGGLFTHALLAELAALRSAQSPGWLDLDFTRRVRRRMMELSGTILDQSPAYSGAGEPIALFASPEAAPAEACHRNAPPPAVPARDKAAMRYRHLALAATLVFLTLTLLELCGCSILRLFWPTLGIHLP